MSYELCPIPTDACMWELGKPANKLNSVNSFHGIFLNMDPSNQLSERYLSFCNYYFDRTTKAALPVS